MLGFCEWVYCRMAFCDCVRLNENKYVIASENVLFEGIEIYHISQYRKVLLCFVYDFFCVQIKVDIWAIYGNEKLKNSVNIVMLVYLSACNNSRTTRQIFIKFSTLCF
jgi:hypothetical protein